MIKKLQVRFIALAMAALLIVLVVIIGGINIVSYISVISQADRVLSLLSENEGRFPTFFGDKGHALPPGMSPELPYESRYFSVTVDTGTGQLIQTDTGRITAVDTEAAISYARTAIKQPANRGFVGNYRYVLKAEGRYTRVIFLNCESRLDSFRNFLLASTGISLLGCVIVFLLLVIFSNRIIRPISESYEKQKQFITDAGHELKTPLTIIKADADVLELEMGKNEWLDDIQKQAQRLSALTGDLVSLARMEEAEKALPMLPFPVSDVISETTQSFQALAETQGKPLICDVQPMLTMKGNEKSVAQLVSILLDNSLKYSPPGGTIRLALEKQGRTLHLRVCNTTVQAMDKEHLSRLFERFYRGDPSRSSQTGGYGIGLSVAKAIVTAHGGRISAAAPEPQSLQISITLPMG